LQEEGTRAIWKQKKTRNETVIPLRYLILFGGAEKGERNAGEGGRKTYGKEKKRKFTTLKKKKRIALGA